MSNDKFPPMPEGPPKVITAVKVKMLRFARQGQGQGVSLGMPFPSDPINLAAGKRGMDGADEIVIQYEPWHRQYRARALANGVVVAERCIPESWAIYDPEPM